MEAFNVNALSTQSPAVQTPKVQAQNVQVQKAPEKVNAGVKENQQPKEKSAERVTELSEKSASPEKVDLSREREDIASVSVSEDGDVVAVSENGVKALSEKEEDDAKVLREENEEFDITEETEEETYEPEINSLVGYTENQIFELYKDGRISYNDYQQHLEKEAAEKETAKAELEESDEEIAAASGALQRVEEENIAIENINGPEGAAAVDAMDRVKGNAPEDDNNSGNAIKIPGQISISVDEGSTKGEVQNTRNERKAAEEGRLWDYQLRA